MSACDRMMLEQLKGQALEADRVRHEYTSTNAKLLDLGKVTKSQLPHLSHLHHGDE